METEADGWVVVLTRRTETLSTHRGEVAFPGGRVELGDAHLTETALREAQEEVNIQPDNVQVLDYSMICQL